jgi:hypothetical protein
LRCGRGKGLACSSASWDNTSHFILIAILRNVDVDQVFTHGHLAPQETEISLFIITMDPLTVLGAAASAAQLQTDSVALVLDTCLQRSRELQSYLDDMSPDKAKGRLRKFKKAFKSVVKEHDTAVLFESLEREKTSLMLCIQEIDK